MMTDQDRGEAILDKPYILVTSQIVNLNQQIIKILNEIIQSDRRHLLLIADQVGGEALPTLLVNKFQNRLLTVAVACPGIGDDKRSQMQDIAILTGAEFISEELGKKIDDASLDSLGSADKVIITKDSTIIIGGAGRKLEIKKRVAQIKQEIENEKSDYERELKERRLARLKGGVAVIRVGSISESENMEKRYRVEDAVRAAKSSLEEGIVPGGGQCLAECSKALYNRLQRETDLSFRVGMSILAESIVEPAKQVLINAGYKPDVILAECDRLGKGFNAATGEYVDLIDSGVIDPAKVVRCALDNAVSVVSLILITDALITNETEDTKKDKN